MLKFCLLHMLKHVMGHELQTSEIVEFEIHLYLVDFVLNVKWGTCLDIVLNVVDWEILWLNAHIRVNHP